MLLELEAEFQAVDPEAHIPAWAFLAVGDRSGFLERAQRDGTINEVNRHMAGRLFWLPAYGPLRERPEFFAAMEAWGYVDTWEALGYPLDCQPAEGYLCLESEGSPVEFRKLRIRVLP